MRLIRGKEILMFGLVQKKAEDTVTTHEKSDLQRRMAIALSPEIGKGPAVILAACEKAAMAKVENPHPLPLEAFKANVKACKTPKIRKVQSAEEKARSAEKRRATLAAKKREAAKKAEWIEVKPGVIRSAKKVSSAPAIVPA